MFLTLTYLEVYIKARTFLDLCLAHSDRSATIFESILEDHRNLTLVLLEEMRPTILANQVRPANVSKSLEWFAHITTYMDLISAIGVDLISAIKDGLDMEVSDSKFSEK